MTTNTETMVNPADTPIDSTTRETVTVEENRTLRNIMAQLWQAWANGQEPPTSIPGFPEIISIRSSSSQVPISEPFFPPGYGQFDNCGVGPSTTRPQGMPFRNTPIVTTDAPVYTLSQVTVTQRAAQDGQFTPHPEQYYTPGIAFGGPNSVQFGSPIDVETPTPGSEQEEMLKKMKSIEQHMKSMQGLGGHKSVAFKDLCMFPNVHLPPGFKTPKFDKYDGHGDPIAHLKRYCNQLRGARGKEELLMAYFGESLTGVVSEWFIDQEISPWHIWDDMAQDFVRQFQYNVDIMQDQAQDPDYSHHLTAAMGRPFHTAIKIGEMVKSGLKTGRIVSHAAIKATTQAIQGGSTSFGNCKRKEEVISLASGSRGAQRKSNCPYTSVQGQLSYPQHYYPYAPQYPVSPSPYTVLNA
ncbi:uncharacterized protein [Solanum lycopersicum]|uniref:uncharacterized protein n=1 Tax=Solanum lycopersicum TaxID=4081 RepID=UPI000532DB81|nr:uncharacterized protein LOC104644931 [Solanum lycopersicum]